jgi:diguanylate cyclase (GGDEF)-like protein
MTYLHGPNASVAWLKAKDDPRAVAGAAFLIESDLALTCAHVVRDHLGLDKRSPVNAPEAPVMLRFEALQRDIEAIVESAGWWPEHAQGAIADVAVLRLSEHLYDVEYAYLARRLANTRTSCYVYGAIEGYERVGQTVWAQIGPHANARGWLQIDAEINYRQGYFVRKGFSGAPIFDDIGNIIWAMVTTVDDNDHDVAFALPASTLKEAVQFAIRAARKDGQSTLRAPPDAPHPLYSPLGEGLRMELTHVRKAYKKILLGVGGERMNKNIDYFAYQMDSLREWARSLLKEAQINGNRRQLTSDRAYGEWIAQLRELAQHDQLTNVENRIAFEMRLRRTVVQICHEGRKGAVIILDLDNFKSINEHMGHAVGDKVLIEVAQRLSSNVASTETVARLGGDEFGIIVDNITDAEDAHQMAARVLQAISQPVRISGHELTVSASVGIALIPEDGGDADHLLRCADGAMYQAKAQGGGVSRRLR